GFPLRGILRVFDRIVYGDLGDLCDGFGFGGYVCPMERVWTGCHSVPNSNRRTGLYVPGVRLCFFPSQEDGPQTPYAVGAGDEPAGCGRRCPAAKARADWNLLLGGPGRGDFVFSVSAGLWSLECT